MKGSVVCCITPIGRVQVVVLMSPVLSKLWTNDASSQQGQVLDRLSLVGSSLVVHCPPACTWYQAGWTWLIRSSGDRLDDWEIFSWRRHRLRENAVSEDAQRTFTVQHNMSATAGTKFDSGIKDMSYMEKTVRAE